MKSGVYQISSTIDDRVYVGSSVNIYSRWTEHKWNLNNGSHQNDHLQRFFDKYGLDCLRFAAIEFCKSHILIEREQMYINCLMRNSIFGLFNISKSASSPMLGRKHKPETLLKIRRVGAENGMFGKKHSKTSKQKMSKSSTGRTKSSEEKLKRLFNLPQRKEVLVTKKDSIIVFFSVSCAAKFLGVTPQSVSKAINLNRKCQGCALKFSESYFFNWQGFLRNEYGFQNGFPKEILLK